MLFVLKQARKKKLFIITILLHSVCFIPLFKNLKQHYYFFLLDWMAAIKMNFLPQLTLLFQTTLIRLFSGMEMNEVY